MVDHVWTVLCSGSSIDYETSVMTIVNVIEQLNLLVAPKEKPIIVPVPFEIVSLWVRQDPLKPSRGKTRVFFCDPFNECYLHSEMDIDTSSSLTCRTRVKSSGLKINDPGKYQFNIELQQENSTEWKKVASIPLFVAFPQNSTVTEPQN